jgi:energy-coupling factor transporter ATP-binding protein EcfA2
MMVTIRFWNNAAVLWCALLLQNCQTRSLGVTEEEKQAESSSASEVRQSVSNESSAQSLTPLGSSSTARISSSRFVTIPAHEEDRFTALPSRALIPFLPSTLATMSNSSTAPYDLPAVAVPRAPRAGSLDDEPRHTPSQDHPYFSSVWGLDKLEEASVSTEFTYPETLISAEETSERSAKRKSSFASAIDTFSPQVEEEMALSLSAPAVQALLSKKLANPTHTLSDQESIALLTHCVAEGAQNAEKIKGKAALVVVGNTGAGKSTFVNYLLGCEMIEKTPEEMEVRGIKVLDDVVVVKSKSEGGCCDEVMPIGHSKTSKTFMPQVAVDPSNPGLAYCDCSGFLDNRGAEINIANAVNIRRALQAAKCVKVLVLINYHSLQADRARGLTDMLHICTKLFGNTSNLSRFQDSLLLGVTKAPANRDLNFLRKWLVEDTPEVMQVLSQRLFLYDPLNRGGENFWLQAECASQIALLKGIPQSQSSHIFQTVLTADDEQKLVEIVEKQSKTLSRELSRGAYSQAGTCWQSLCSLGVIDNIRVERILHLVQLRLQHVVAMRVATFRDYVVHYRFAEAQKHLSSLHAMSSHFATASLEIDLDELTHHRAHFEKKQAAEVKQQQEYREAQERYAADAKRLLAVIASQKQEMASRLSALLSEHAQETSKLRVEMIRRGEDYDAQITKLREENNAALRKQAEQQSLSQALSAEERAKLQETQAQLRRDYEAKLSEAEREKAQFRSEYEALLAQQEEAQAQSRQSLQAQIAQLSAQEATKKAELAKTVIPSMAFGPQKWSKYYGEVGVAPPLPADIDSTLNSRCPFWPDRKVRDTHLLVLLPATVDGKPFTLNLLEELIQRPKIGGHKTRYRHYGDATKAQIGNNLPDRSYWLLMTRDVLPESRSKTYTAQKELVASHASRTGLPYELPKALEAATAILTRYARTGERLYGHNPLTYTRCQEWILHQSGEYPVAVGGFESSGFDVGSYDYGFYDGVAGLRKFCEGENAKTTSANRQDLSTASSIPTTLGAPRTSPYYHLLAAAMGSISRSEPLGDELGCTLSPDNLLVPLSKAGLSGGVSEFLGQEVSQGPRTALSMAFGPQEWSKYYGKVEKVPPLPTDIEATLDAPCPFWPDRKVRDTHLLVLLPATVDGKPFTLNLLSELIKSPKSGEHKTQYGWYDSGLREKIGAVSPAASYWLLMTRDVLPESRNKTYADQKELVAGHAMRTGLPYELPKALEAATAILTHYVRNGERLYSTNPWTYTRCQEWVLYQSNKYPAVVGGFESSSLGVSRSHYGYDDRSCGHGVAGFRKF